MTLTARVARLAEQCKADDEDALIELINVTTRVLVANAKLRRLNGDALLDAEDVLQETYLRYWSRRRFIAPHITLPWLIRVAKNVRSDALRSIAASNRRLSREYIMRLRSYRFEHTVEDPHSDFWRAFRALDARSQRIVFLLGDGFSSKEIAADLGIGRMRVYQLLVPIRQQLAV